VSLGRFPTLAPGQSSSELLPCGVDASPEVVHCTAYVVEQREGLPHRLDDERLPASGRLAPLSPAPVCVCHTALLVSE
jgi:hypothetical protein